MVDGESGLSGINVLLPVVALSKKELDHVITQSHNFKVMIVPLMARRILRGKDVMKIHVLVCTTIFYSALKYKHVEISIQQ